MPRPRGRPVGRSRRFTWSLRKCSGRVAGFLIARIFPPTRPASSAPRSSYLLKSATGSARRRRCDLTGCRPVISTICPPAGDTEWLAKHRRYARAEAEHHFQATAGGGTPLAGAVRARTVASAAGAKTPELLAARPARAAFRLPISPTRRLSRWSVGLHYCRCSPATKASRPTRCASCTGPLPAESMRVWFINRFYWPDEPATAQLLGDLAEALAARGWPVSVIASHPGDAQTRPGKSATELRFTASAVRAGVGPPSAENSLTTCSSSWRRWHALLRCAGRCRGRDDRSADAGVVLWPIVTLRGPGWSIGRKTSTPRWRWRSLRGLRCVGRWDCCAVRAISPGGIVPAGVTLGTKWRV